eukprot:TRINITY_DN1387_c0_g2_i1.p2 TRINITY_DN1387_c0_g2~~TRINITY_DN1387_c0_g2_i1.p2  ORF type:complete len:139 (+),score=32.03 TRINITY_DN1387_c0_g2_i1:666-1082(+)
MEPLTPQDEEDVVFTEQDAAGNPILGFSTGAVLSTTLTQTGLPCYPEGTEQPEHKITVCPFLRSVANSVKHVQGQRTPSFNQLTYNRFPAVAPIVLKLNANHAAEQAGSKPAASAPLIVDVTETLADDDAPADANMAA